MAGIQLGQELIIGIGQTIGNYIIESISVGDDDIHQEDVRDEDGVLATRIIMQTMDKITLGLIPKSGATPESDFQKGTITSVAPLVDYFVETMSFDRTEASARVSVTALLLGIT